MLIVSGEKKEEYRDITPYYNSRLAKHEGELIPVIFQNGYCRSSRRLYSIVLVDRLIGGNPKWGANPYKVYWILRIQIKSFAPII